VAVVVEGLALLAGTVMRLEMLGMVVQVVQVGLPEQQQGVLVAVEAVEMSLVLLAMVAVLEVLEVQVKQVLLAQQTPAVVAVVVLEARVMVQTVVQVLSL
jgi:hypothetical protein